MSPLKIVRTIVTTTAVLVLGAAGLLAYLDHLATFQSIRDGAMPALAASDREAFEALSHPSEVGPSFADLKAQGRLFSIEHGTQCQVIRFDTSSTCQGEEHPVEVKLRDGPRRGAKVWICSYNVSRPTSF